MLTYSFRLDFSDGTFAVVSVDASSIAAALSLLGTVDDCVGTTLLGSVDRTPQTALAFA